MPFERYLRDENHPDYTSHRQDLNRDVAVQDDTNHSHALQFQIPQFMLNGPPLLAPGGGAEVLPVSLLGSASDSLASCWFTNNGFTPFHAALTPKNLPSSSTADIAGSFNESQHHSPIFSPSVIVSSSQRQQPFPGSSSSAGALFPFLPNSASSSSSSHVTSTPLSLSDELVPNPAPPLSLTPSSTLGLPVYSASGFDILTILSRVLYRPNPTIQLGPVDFSCSFVIVDVRRYDCPIVYASPTFCHLTGYSEQEALGRNCRFLQSPTGDVAKGGPRHFTSPDAVSYMRKSLSSSKECQTTLINYRKNGQAFINLVTVIPLRGGVYNTPEELDQVAYHIGFQVDLTEQPNRILDKLRDGSYNNNSWGPGSISSDAGIPTISRGLSQLVQSQNMTNIGTKGGRHGQMMSMALSGELKNLIADRTFTDSIRISTGTNMSGPTNTSSGSVGQASNATVALTMFVTPPGSTSGSRLSGGGNTTATSDSASVSPSLSLLLLEVLPDFLLVLSLKGAFLYVAPSVRLVLGYEPEDLVSRGISDICHPADLVPLMRELKEGSMGGLNSSSTNDVGSSTGSSFPKSVDLLFRALPKASKPSPSPLSSGTSHERDDFQHPQSSSVSGSQSSSSAGTLHSNNSLDGSAVPYVWLECRGRLHVEPGKGRKAIILSARARWMPVVRWSTINKAGGLGYGGWPHRKEANRVLHMTTGSSFNESPPGEVSGGASIDPSEFWALLSTQGTFLVASASVRDVLGWGTSEMIGRCLWTMVRDSRSDIRQRVEADLTTLDPEGTSVVDPPATVVTTCLIHKEYHVVPVRLVLYRTPRSRKHTPPSTSSIGAPPTPLIHPLNNPLCPIVCQATVLSDSTHQMGDRIDFSSGLEPGHGSSQVDMQADHTVDDNGSSRRRPDVSIFEELEADRGTSWQYELQQLKFANQRLREEVRALEKSIGTRAGSPSGVISTGQPRRIASSRAPFGPHCSPPSAIVPSTQQQVMMQPPLHYMPLMHATLPISSSSRRPPNSLHDQDPPSSVWSSLAGANGQGTIPLKRPWGSGDT